VLHVVLDQHHGSMWRVRMPDGQVSDMLNLSRAKDAASALALGILNAGFERTTAPPVRRTRRGGTTLAAA
jgi:hypothetical protein